MSSETSHATVATSVSDAVGDSTTNNSNSSSSKITRMVGEIGKRLSKRPEREEIVQKNILKEQPNVSPALVQAKIELEKQKFQDKLSGKIGRRPSKQELEARNIIRPDDNDEDGENDEDGASEEEEEDRPVYDYMPTTVIEVRSKTFADRQNQLKSILKRRPEKESLESKNILRGEKQDPSLHAATEKLKRAQLENVLESKIKARPNPEQIKSVLNFNEVVEVLPTFRATDYNRKTDDSFTFKRLTPKLKQEIREELNQFKREEMEIHGESAHNTAFH